VQLQAKETLIANDDNALARFIRDTIRERGPVTFRWFMEQALYHPDHGFYSSGRCAIGRQGDYFTNVSVGSLFGRLMAAQFIEIWESLGQPNEFTIVEQGAHDGTFASDALAFAQVNQPEFFETLRYRIIEPFPNLQVRQEAKLQAVREKIEWQKSLEQSKPFTGIHFSNELIDALPVHLIAGSKGAWQEKYVTSTDEHFEFIGGPLSTSELRKQTKKCPPPNSNYETEVNLAALDWIELLSAKLERGFVLAVDYGYSRGEFFAPERTSGTLRSFANQRAVSSPLLNVGQTDITTHVNWTSLIERAEECGLRFAGFTDQHHFITALATALPNELEARDRRGLQTLLHPELLGRTFQFLVFAKNLAKPSQLTGFKFARDPRAELGLSPG
jgi:SAM-dependent MidA family methyltransferase